MKPRILINLRNVPVYQNKAYSSRSDALACPVGDLRLSQDPFSGIITNTAYEHGLLTYDATYQNEQGVSMHFRSHLEAVADKVAAGYAGRRILEIGCGKGLFVELMRERGLDARGVDNAYEGDADYIEKRHFGSGIEVASDLIVLRHVLEHIPDPVDFLRQIATANQGLGHVLIEVPCFDWIMQNRAWFDVFYEHVNYFRISDLTRLFSKVVEFGPLFGGQYIFLIAELSSLAPEADRPMVNDVEFPEDFFDRIDTIAKEALTTPDRNRIVWGAAAKGVMFAHHLSKRGVQLKCAVDINPAKQGRYLPSTGLPVMAPGTVLPELPGDSEIYVMNSNYLHEIRNTAGDRFRYISVDRR